MGIFGPSRAERLESARRAVQPYGFDLSEGLGAGLRAYEPFALLSSPSRYVAGAIGAIEGARVEAYEYTYSASDPEGNTTWHDAVVVAIHHPWVLGGAAFQPDHKQWGGVAAVVDALLWIPPFILLKAFQFAMESRNPDRTVGTAEFDRLYRVRAPSDAAASRAIPPALREVCLRLQFRGDVELRPGLLLCSPYDAAFDDKLASTLGIGAAMLGALAPDPSRALLP